MCEGRACKRLVKGGQGSNGIQLGPHKEAETSLASASGERSRLERPLPDTLECEVKWALGSITTNKASGGDGIPVELFQILKDDSVKVPHSIRQQIWKTQQWPQDWKRSVFILIPREGNAKECSKYCTIPLISHTSKVISKFPKPGFKVLEPDVQAGFRNGSRTRYQIVNIR